MKDIAYIIVGEDLGSPLLRRQVIELLKKIKEKSIDSRICIYNFQGFLSIINHRNDLLRISRELKSVGILHRVIPNVCPWPIPNLGLKKTEVGWRPYSVWNRFAAQAFAYLSLPWFFLINKIGGFGLLHCRSYVSSYAAIVYKKFFPKTEVVFDPRSDFPEEGVTAGFWKEESADFKFWKRVEADILKKANKVALISQAYLNHYKCSVDCFRYFIAPNNVATDVFVRDSTKRLQVRERLGYLEDDLVFVYLGALSHSGWHRPHFYINFYDALKKSGVKFKFLFLVPFHCKAYTESVLSKIEEKQVISPGFTEVADYLSASDFGMMFFHRRKVAVGTKIGEYLCMGLPIIVNRNCIGATDYLDRQPDAGAIINLGLGDLDGTADINVPDLCRLRRSDTRLAAVNFFGADKVADIYLNNYEIS